MIKKGLILVFFLYTQLMFCQDKMVLTSSNQIENQFFINGNKMDISGKFNITLKDNNGKLYNIPVKQNFVNLEKVSDNVESYEITFDFDSHRLKVCLFTKYILTNEQSIWIWNIDTINSNVEPKCELKTKFIESGIEIDWPVDCSH